jgi:hypothetical protein
VPCTLRTPMNRYLLAPLLLVAFGLGACSRTEPAPPPVVIAVPGPAGATGATGDVGKTGATGDTGKAATDTTVIVVPVPAPAASAPAN